MEFIMKRDHVLIKLSALASDGVLTDIDGLTFKSSYGHLIRIAGPYIVIEFDNVKDERSYINCYYEDIYDIDFNGKSTIIYDKYEAIMVCIY